MDHNWIGNQIAMLRKKKGYSGERFSELLGVTPQAVSKWETGKSLPETALLPKLAQTLEITIDQLLIKREILITKAIFSDGVDATDLTMRLNQFVMEHQLSLFVRAKDFGISKESDRLGVLLVEYQLPSGNYSTYALENTYLVIDNDTKGKQYHGNGPLEIIGAYYGTKENYRDCLAKMSHYEYFDWKKIWINDEIFPSSPCTDEIEYLTIIYLNKEGIHSISAAEKETLLYTKGKSELKVEDQSTCILPGIDVLEYGQGMDCTWGGAMTFALNYMGMPYSYEQVMGMSGACYRFAFCEVWDWSATDALVAFDYASILFQAVGVQAVWANRLEKNEREKEREAIVADILQNKPVLAINLRVAPEWGVITGYAEGGKRFYCRTYFDEEYLNEQKDYLESDNWPFLIQHFGEKTEELTAKEMLRASLQAMIDSYEASCERGYYQGKEGYEYWIRGLRTEELWNHLSLPNDIERRLEVNDALLLNLADARRCASIYLKECTCILSKEGAEKLDTIANCYDSISKRVLAFREKLVESQGEILTYNLTLKAKMNTTLREEQAVLIEKILEEEKQVVEKARLILGEM